MFRLVHCIFYAEWKLQKWLMNITTRKTEKLEKVASWITLIILIIVVIIVVLGMNKVTSSFALPIVLVFSIAYVVCKFLLKSVKTFATVRGFLSIGLIFMLLCTLGLVQIFDWALLEVSNEINLSEVFLFNIAFVVAWLITCSLCNAEVATLCNAVFSVLTGFFLQASDTLLPHFIKSAINANLPHSVLNGLDREMLLITESAEAISYANEVLMPLFIAFAMGTIICAMKKYWIKVYNNGNDINRYLKVNELENEQAKNINIDNKQDLELRRKIIEEYKTRLDSDVLNYISQVNRGASAPKYVVVSKISKKAAKEIKRLTGRQTEGNEIVLDSNAVKHIINRHGVNGARDTSMSDINDIARMGYVIDNFDEISEEGRTTTGYLDEEGNPSQIVVFSKRINGTYYVVEATGSSLNKRSYILSAYITKS